MAGEVIPAAAGNYNSSQFAVKAFTFTGAAGFGAAGTNCTLLSPGPVAGMFIIRSMMVLTTGTLSHGVGATMSLGASTVESALIAATAGTQIAPLYTMWVATTGNNASDGIMPATMRDHAFFQTITCTPAVADFTAGTITLYVVYDALSPGTVLT